MAWKVHEVNNYKVAVGGSNYYGTVQLFGTGLIASLKFYKEGPLPDCVDQIRNNTQYFYGHMDFQQMSVTVDLLRNEAPINLIWSDINPNLFHLSSSSEPIGEGDG